MIGGASGVYLTGALGKGVRIDEQNFVLVNLYNANTEKDQLNTINELKKMLKSVKDKINPHNFS